ncbi:MAG: hypothetical protein KC439_05880 [Yoonia sp.]|nr:hypothetical protein [Yoonia sp.]
MDVSIVIILIAVGLFIIREIHEKLDWFKGSERRQIPTGDLMALKAGIIENPRPEHNPERLKFREDGFENGVEVRWGRRNDPIDGTFTQIKEKEIIPFLEKNRDYALWYKVVQHDFGGEVLEWIVSQPDCPNAVATAFLNALRADSIYGKTDLKDIYYYRAVEIISRRDANEGFPSDTMRDPEPDEDGFYGHFEKVDRVAMLERFEAIARAQLALGNTLAYAVPKNLLSTSPTGPSLRTEYDVDEVGIY